MNKKQKEAEKELKQSMKQLAKEYGYKVVSNSMYKTKNNFFMHSVFFIKWVEEKPKVVIWTYIKPYGYDDIF